MNSSTLLITNGHFPQEFEWVKLRLGCVAMVWSWAVLLWFEVGLCCYGLKLGCVAMVICNSFTGSNVCVCVCVLMMMMMMFKFSGSYMKACCVPPLPPSLPYPFLILHGGGPLSSIYTRLVSCCFLRNGRLGYIPCTITSVCRVCVVSLGIHSAL